MAQDAFKTPAVFRSLDLSRVCRAHGRQRVGVNEPPFQEVQIIEELQLARGEPIPSESRQRKVDFPEPPLVGEVMEGEDRPRARKGLRVERFHVERHQGGLPVVNVNDVGREAADAEELKGAAAKEDEPRRVVSVVAVLVPVEARPVEEEVVLEEMEIPRSPDRAPRGPLAQGDRDELGTGFQGMLAHRPM